MLLRFGEPPESDRVTPEWHGKTAHVRLIVGDDALMGSDAPSDARGMPDFSVALNVHDAAEAERAFAAPEERRIDMPLQETFWATRSGMLIDRFAVAWMASCTKPGY